MSNLRLVALCVVGLGAALAGGWYSAVPDDVDESALVAASRGGDRSLALVKPNAAFAEAAAALDRLGLAEPAAPVAATPDAPVEQEPSITAELRRDMTAILSERNGRALLVIDREKGEERIKLRTGDTFRRGWKIERITAQHVVLAREGERQTMPIMSLDDVEPEIPAEDGAGGAPG